MTYINSGRLRKIADAEAFLPGIAAIWPQIKAECRTSARRITGITITDRADPVCADDGELVRRFSLDLATMTLGDASHHVSTGEWAIANTGAERAVADVPDGAAVLTCMWHDYHHYFSIELQVRPGAIPAQLAK